MHMFTAKHIFTKSSTTDSSSKLENTQMLISSRIDKLIVVRPHCKEKESTLNNMKEFHKNNFEGKELVVFFKHLLDDYFYIKNKNRQNYSML